MTLSEKQKNCPYCHPDISNLKDFQGVSPWYYDQSGNLKLHLDEVKGDINVDNEGEGCFGDIAFSPTGKTLSSWDDGANPLIVHIQHCPFCGRKLGD